MTNNYFNVTLLLGEYYDDADDNCSSTFARNYSNNASAEMTTPDNRSDECSVFSDLYPDIASATWTKVVFGALYSVIFVFGCFGNFVMLYVTLTKRAMITVQNIFLMNLALSDIVVCLLSVPVTPIVLVYKEWYFGSPLCHLIMWVQGSSIFISTLTLTAIALDRYTLIVYPHRKPTTIRGSLWITAAIWAFSGVVTLPYAYFMHIVRYDGVCGEFCDEAWPSDEAKWAFTTLVFAFQFVIPFAIMSYCYVAILDRLRQRIKSKMSRTANYGGNERTSGRHGEKTTLTKRKRRSTFVLVCMVSIFGLTWLPNNVISMITNYAQRIIPTEYIYFVYLIAHCFAMLSILANPVLYAWLNSAFRKIIVKTCTNCRLRLLLRNIGGGSRSTRSSLMSTGGGALGGGGTIGPELCTDYLMRQQQESFRRGNRGAKRDDYGRNFLTPVAIVNNNNNNNSCYNNSSTTSNYYSSYGRSSNDICRTPTPDITTAAAVFNLNLNINDDRQQQRQML